MVLGHPMITLVCTKCQSTLTVDDGFAGGVCRCSRCGTIQTVPTHEQAAAGRLAGGKSLYERKDRAGSSSRDLEHLSDVISGSGLAGSGLNGGNRPRPGSGRTEPRPRPAIEPPANPRNLVPALLLAIGVLLALLGGVVGYLLSRDGGSPPAANSVAVAVDPTGAAPTGRDAAFGPIDLRGTDPVIYLLDRGEATKALLPSLKRATLASARSLGPSRPVQVRFWESNGDRPAVPSRPQPATDATLRQIEVAIRDVEAVRSTDLLPALTDALAAEPGQLVVATGKAWQLDEAFAEAALGAVGSRRVRVHTVALGDTSDNTALEILAGKTGGTAVKLDRAGIDRLAQ